MEFVAIAIFAALVFGACYLADKGFSKVFRGKVQHKSGKSVRLSKKYGSIGLIIAVLGLAAVFTGFSDGWVLPVCGCLLIIVGMGLVVYYMTFGVFYDEDSFILTTFGKRSTTYHYREIKAQQLYNSYGSTIIELHMHDGRTVHLQAGMIGAYPFLDYAFEQWLVQTGRKQENCSFYDPDNSCWFPPVED